VSVPTSSSRVRVRYAETDQMGVVYYANYLVWFEVGRTDLLRKSGWSYREMEVEGYALPVVEAHCEYRQSARYDDELDIRTSGTLLSPVRVRFVYDVVRVADQAKLAGGHTVHAALDPAGKPRRLPERVRAVFTD
jgi:acyl-CoA thioester hydrolase